MSQETLVLINRFTGFDYAGVSYRTYCHCGTSYGKYGAAPESECSEVCSGDNYQTCGGYWTNAIYKTKSGIIFFILIIIDDLYNVEV